jgi:hypothetical protein
MSNTKVDASFISNLKTVGGSSIVGSGDVPFDGVGFRNRIINGDMRIDQRNSGAAVAAGDRDLKDWWGYSNDFERLNPQVTAMGTALAQTDKQLDDLWILGATL